MARTADFIVIGGGIAGASVAYELLPHGSVIVLEQESATGYHSTGRSAAVMSENYGPKLWSRLVSATRGFLENPPEGFATAPLVSDRGALFLAQAHEAAQLQAQYDDLIARGAQVELIAASDALRYCEVLRAEKYATAMYEPDCKDVDTNELMMGYLPRSLESESLRKQMLLLRQPWTKNIPDGHCLQLWLSLLNIGNVSPKRQRSSL